MIHELRKKLIKICAISALAVLALIFIFIMGHISPADHA